MNVQVIKKPPTIHKVMAEDEEKEIVITLCGLWCNIDKYKVVGEGDDKVTCLKCLSQLWKKGKQGE